MAKMEIIEHQGGQVEVWCEDEDEGNIFLLLRRRGASGAFVDHIVATLAPDEAELVCHALGACLDIVSPEECPMCGGEITIDHPHRHEVD
jgi:hypothetical protein